LAASEEVSIYRFNWDVEVLHNAGQVAKANVKKSNVVVLDVLKCIFGGFESKIGH
jgi:hypothetical protein